MEKEKNTIEERLSFIEFRQELLFNNSELDRMLFEYEITREEYKKIMGLMESIRVRIDEGEAVSSSDYESKMYDIVPSHTGDYHMCEYLARAFMDEGRWEEVFPALYGHMTKYRYLKGND